jgi:hypothetical protein
MGRMVKRVPLDFDWPVNIAWPGYILPDELDLPECEECDGEGCEACRSSGVEGTDDQQDAYLAWEPSGPPEGEGWQLWMTTTEPTPMSPVFRTAEELADWCAENATMRSHYTASREKWLAFIQDERSTRNPFVIW